MPDSGQIVENLDKIAANGLALAVFWHVYVGVILLALLSGWRPGNRPVGLSVTPPLWSVGALAFHYGNPFNGILFFSLSATATMIVFSMTPESIQISRAPYRVAGAALIVFGWAYPQFVDSAAPLFYLYGPPLGLLPCPTLAVVIGMGILLTGFRNPLWIWMFAAAGMFYGFYGAAKLGVQMDWVLFAGALLLAVSSLQNRPHGRMKIESGSSASKDSQCCNPSPPEQIHNAVVPMGSASSRLAH